MKFTNYTKKLVSLVFTAALSTATLPLLPVQAGPPSGRVTVLQIGERSREVRVKVPCDTCKMKAYVFVLVTLEGDPDGTSPTEHVFVVGTENKPGARPVEYVEPGFTSLFWMSERGKPEDVTLAFPLDVPEDLPPPPEGCPMPDRALAPTRQVVVTIVTGTAPSTWSRAAVGAHAIRIAGAYLRGEDPRLSRTERVETVPTEGTAANATSLRWMLPHIDLAIEVIKGCPRGRR